MGVQRVRKITVDNSVDKCENVDKLHTFYTFWCLFIQKCIYACIKFWCKNVYNCGKVTKKRVAKATLKLKTGNDISSHKASLVVFSALKVFTSVFGMRTGVSPSLISPVMAECL